MALIRFDGGSAINVTGFQARVEGAIIIVSVLGAGTVTLKNNSGSSEDRNKILTQSGGDLAIATGFSAMLQYQNTRWREVKFA